MDGTPHVISFFVNYKLGGPKEHPLKRLIELAYLELLKLSGPLNCKSQNRVFRPYLK